jgi:hypothetical protein
LDAFSCPALKKSHQKATKQLLETRGHLDEMKISYQSLEENLSERENYFSKREGELQELHRSEIAKGERNFSKIASIAMIRLKRHNFHPFCDVIPKALVYQIQNFPLTFNFLFFEIHENFMELLNFNALTLSPLKTAEKSLDDLDNEKREKVESLEKELACQQKAADDKLRESMMDAEEKIRARDSELLEAKDRENDLLKRIQALTMTEHELREKVHTSEMEFSEKLHLSNLRERDLSEKINQLTKQLDEMRTKSDGEKRELEEKLNLSQDELLVTRQSRNSSGNESFHNRTINLNQSQLLADEVESLRCVLELKQSEISDLRKQNCELQRAADETFAAQVKCSALESRVEDLQVQLGARHEEEK